MEVTLFILLGDGEKKCNATKQIKLDFAPVQGMKFDDGTWKDSGGRIIDGVTIDYSPEENVTLFVTLEPDYSDTRKDLADLIYKPHGWEISGLFDE